MGLCLLARPSPSALALSTASSATSASGMVKLSRTRRSFAGLVGFSAEAGAAAATDAGAFVTDLLAAGVALFAEDPCSNGAGNLAAGLAVDWAGRLTAGLATGSTGLAAEAARTDADFMKGS